MVEYPPSSPLLDRCSVSLCSGLTSVLLVTRHIVRVSCIKSHSGKILWKADSGAYQTVTFVSLLKEGLIRLVLCRKRISLDGRVISTGRRIDWRAVRIAHIEMHSFHSASQGMFPLSIRLAVWLSLWDCGQVGRAKQTTISVARSFSVSGCSIENKMYDGMPFASFPITARVHWSACKSLHAIHPK